MRKPADRLTWLLRAIIAAAAALFVIAIDQAFHAIDGGRVTACQARALEQIDAPDYAPVWTSPACRGLSLDEMATAHSRVAVAYQLANEVGR